MYHCHVCYEIAGFVGRDDDRNYFECSGKEIWHEWSELRNPICANCDEPLMSHDTIIDEGATLTACPTAVGSVFEPPEDTR